MSVKCLRCFWIFLLMIASLRGGAQGSADVSISGAIRLLDGTPAPGVVVLLEGDVQAETLTDAEGHYVFLVPEGGGDYRVRPCAGEGILNGVTGFDLVLIHMHIVGVQPLASPYELIKADVNNDGEIDPLDLADLRKLILGGSSVFPDNTPWRFVPAGYVFPDPQNPFEPSFPETLSFQADTDIEDADFFILKTGDLQVGALPPPGGACSPAWAVLSGKAFFDENGDCLPGPGEPSLAGRIVRISGGGVERFTRTLDDGRYWLVLPPGMYEVQLTPREDVWTPCPAQALLLAPGDKAGADLGLQANTACHWLQVALSTAVLQPCQTAAYYIDYQNKGPETAFLAQIALRPDPWMTLVSAEIPWTSPDGVQYFFSVGDLAPGTSGRFSVSIALSCEALPGQAHRLEARIEPDYLPCLPLNPAWDGAALRLDGRCEQDSLRFTIFNAGEGMQAVSSFIVIEDDMIMRTEPFQLGPGESLPLLWAGTGATYRVSLPQSPGHPGESRPTFALEGCGAVPFSTGFVSVFPEDQVDDFKAVSVLESLENPLPFYKDGYPKGYRQKRLIEAGQWLDYHIRFRNTGEDTLSLAAVVDSLSIHLDWASFEPGAGSHPYSVKLKPGAGAVFIMENAALAPGERGFVSFRIRTRPDLPAGTFIQNPAEVFFHNQPSVTIITSHHTIGSDFLESLPVSAVEKVVDQSGWRLSPNPAAAACLLSGPESLKGPFTLELRNAMGHLLRTERFAHPEYRIGRGGLPAGLYFLHIFSEGRPPLVFRLIFI